MIPPKDDEPTERVPLVTFALIALNVLAFAWQLFHVGVLRSVNIAGAIPYEILTFEDVEWRNAVPPPFTLFTGMFLHGSFQHVATNMVALWIFGKDVEDALGRARFVVLYLAAGVVAALAQTVALARSGASLTPVVGASGAIAGVLAGHLLLFPHGRVLRVVPAPILLGGWFVLQVLSIVVGGDPGIAFVAHVVGFVAGYLLVRVVGRRPSWRARRTSS